MDERLERSDLPDLRKFLDDLPMKPCPSKLPEEYCKICRRLNVDVAHYCKTRKLPEKPEREISEEDIPLGRLEPLKEEEETKQPHEILRRSPILERPTYKDGDTSLEFVSSQRSIEEARKALPRFIPVRKGPRTFRPIEDEIEMEFETFSPSRSSIFKEPSLLGHDEDDMMFSLVDDDAIEVVAVEVLSDDSYTSETVFSSADGVVEVIDDHDDMPLMTFEEEVPAFEFMPSDEGEIIEAEIVEAEILEDEPTFETYTTQEQLKDTKQGIQDLTEEITDMTESLEKEFQEREPSFTPSTPEVQEEDQVESEPYEPEKADLAPEIPAEPSEMRFKVKDEIHAEEPQVPQRKLKKKKMKMKLKKTKKKRIKRTKKKKPEELEPIEDHAFIPQVEEPEPELIEEEPSPEAPLEEPEPVVDEPFPETPQEEPEPKTEEPSEMKFKIKDEIQTKEPHVPEEKLKKKMKLRKTKKKKPKDLKPIDDHAFIPQVEEPELEPIVEEPFPEVPQEEPEPVVDEPSLDSEVEEPEPKYEESFPETPHEEPEPIGEEPFPETPQEEPELIVDEPFPDTEIEEPEPIVEEPFPDTEIEEPEPIVEEPFPDTPIEEPEPIDEKPFPKPPWIDSEPIVEETLPEPSQKEPELIVEEPEMETGFTPDEPLEPESQETPFEPPTEEPAEGGAADLYMCPSCGAFVSGSASICIKCGYDFEAEEQREQVEEPPYEPWEEPPTSDQVIFKSKSRGELPEGEKPTEKKTKKKKKKKVKLKKKKKMKLKKVKKK